MLFLKMKLVFLKWFQNYFLRLLEMKVVIWNSIVILDIYTTYPLHAFLLYFNI